MKIVIDVFGGDNAPHEIVEGCIEVINNTDDISLILTGNSELIEAELKKYKFDRTKIELVNAMEVITNDDVPTVAIKTKKESSLVKALEIVKNDESVVGMVSAGSSGAVLTGGVLRVGRIKGIVRPALAPILPTKKGTDVCLIDCGANVDCRAEFLVHFALMGISYMKSVYGIENPRVALVSVGVEDKKGNELTKEVFPLLKALPINFVGNMEARDALTGDYDVLVCDGFVGNVLLKSTEGCASLIMTMLKRAIMSSSSAKFGSLFMKKAFKQLKNDMDYNTKGGAPFLGIEKIIVKAHGSSNSVAISAAILQVRKMAQGNLVENIKKELVKLQVLQSQTAEKKDE